MIPELGQLRYFVTFQRDNGALSDGSHTEDWQAIANASDVPASVETVSGGEVRRGMQMDAMTTVLVRCIHPGTVFTLTPKDRVLFDSRFLNIVSAYDPTNMGMELHVQCREDV